MLVCGTASASDYSVICDNQSRTVTFKLTNGSDSPLVVYIQDAEGNIIAIGDTTVNGTDHEAVLPVPGNVQTDKIYTAIIEDFLAVDDVEKIPFEERSKEIYISDASKNTNILSDISTKTGTELKEAFEEYYKELDVDISTDYTVSFADAFANIRGEKQYSVFSEIKNDFETAKSVAFLADADKTELLEKGKLYLKELGISADVETDEKEMWRVFSNVRKKITEKTIIPDDIKKWYNESLAVSAVNTSNREQLGKVIEEYGALLGIDVNKYTSIKIETQKMIVNKSLHAKNFSNAEEVKKAYNDAVKSLNVSQPAGGGGGGGGGGGTGNKTSSSPSSETLPYSTDKKNTSHDENNVTQTKHFSDLTSSHWAYEAMTATAEKGIISGYSDNSVKPDNFVTRAEFIKIIVSAVGKYNSEAKCSFSDISENEWYYSYIASAVNEGFVNGYEDNTFMPGSLLTRQDAALMIFRAVKRDFQNKAVFTDKDSISDYALEAVVRLGGAGIIKGFENGEFRPLDNITRAQAAQLVFNLIKEG